MRSCFLLQPSCLLHMVFKFCVLFWQSCWTNLKINWIMNETCFRNKYIFLKKNLKLFIVQIDEIFHFLILIRGVWPIFTSLFNNWWKFKLILQMVQNIQYLCINYSESYAYSIVFWYVHFARISVRTELFNMI